MEPKVFRDRWGFSNAQLAELLGQSVGTVNFWMVKDSGKSHRPCPEETQKRLAEIDCLLKQLEHFPAHILRFYLEHIVSDVGQNN